MAELKQSYYDDFLQENQLTDYLVTISCTHANVHLAGIINEEEISLGLSASYDQSIAATTLTDAAKGGANAIMDKLGVGFLKGMTDSLKSINSTINTYSSSGNFSINISFNVYPGKFHNPHNYNTITKQIAKLTQPALIKNTVMVSELYDIKTLKSLSNNYKLFDKQLICLTIGKWFKLCGLYCTSSNISYSTIIDTEGKPLFIKVNLTLEPYRVLTADEIAGIIRSGKKDKK